VKVEVDDFSKALADALSEYTKDIADGVKAAVDEAGKELLIDIRAAAPVRLGKYKKAMSIKTVRDDNYEKKITWYVKPPHYRLTHLLEHGHAKRGGGRVKAYPHIFENADAAIARFEARVKEVIENGG